MKPRPGGLFADRFRLERKVGGGRVCDVWRAVDEQSHARVALRFQHRAFAHHPEASARFALEQTIARELQGAYFAGLVDRGVWNECRYLAWQWHEGESLRDLLERNPIQDAQTLDTVMREACAALSCVHRAGYVHGNLKPENLFLEEQANTTRRQLKLLGFKVASRAADAGGVQRRVGLRRVVGTPLYLSLGQARGRARLAPRDDLWALGVIAYEALTGKMPFWGDGAESVVDSIGNRRCKLPSHWASVGAEFDQFWQRVLDEEFSDAEDFSRALNGALEPALRGSLTQRSAFVPVSACEAQPPRNASSASSGTDRVEPEPPTAASQPSTRGSFAAVEATPQNFRELRSQTLIGLNPADFRGNAPTPAVQEAMASAGPSGERSAASDTAAERAAEAAAAATMPPAPAAPPAGAGDAQTMDTGLGREEPLLLTNVRGSRRTIRFPEPPVGGAQYGPRDTVRQLSTPQELGKAVGPQARLGSSRRHQWVAAALVCGLALLVVWLRASRDRIPRVNTLGQKARALGAANVTGSQGLPAYGTGNEPVESPGASHDMRPDAEGSSREPEFPGDRAPSTPHTAPGRTAG